MAYRITIEESTDNRESRPSGFYDVYEQTVHELDLHSLIIYVNEPLRAHSHEPMIIDPAIYINKKLVKKSQ